MSTDDRMDKTPDRYLHGEPHFHTHTIVVEWEYIWEYGDRFKHEETPTGKRATKLLCSCGDIKRVEV